jgi:hypothetical protein
LSADLNGGAYGLNPLLFGALSSTGIAGRVNGASYGIEHDSSGMVLKE